MKEGIVATELSIRRGRVQAVDNISFSVQPGRLVGLIGPSGSGKTTLMRAIVGVQKVTDGQLQVLGQKAGSRVLRRQLGYVTQAPAIYDDLTVLQNIRYFGALTKATCGQIDNTIVQVQLEKQRQQLAGNLSGGQRARVSLAIALLGNPEVLVLDEPTVGLDPLLRRELWELFASLAKQGKTLLISSHVMDEAERCDDILLMREGKLLWQDSRATLLASTKKRSVEDAFISLITAETPVKPASPGKEEEA